MPSDATHMTHMFKHIQKFNTQTPCVPPVRSLKIIRFCEEFGIVFIPLVVQVLCLINATYFFYSANPLNHCIHRDRSSIVDRRHYHKESRHHRCSWFPCLAFLPCANAVTYLSKPPVQDLCMTNSSSLSLLQINFCFASYPAWPPEVSALTSWAQH